MELIKGLILSFTQSLRLSNQNSLLSRELGTQNLKTILKILDHSAALRLISNRICLKMLFRNAYIISERKSLKKYDNF